MIELSLGADVGERAVAGELRDREPLVRDLARLFLRDRMEPRERAELRLDGPAAVEGRRRRALSSSARRAAASPVATSGSVVA